MALARGQIPLARESFHEGLTLAHKSDIKAYFVYNLIGHACVLLTENEQAAAVKLLSAATAVADSIGFKMETELKQPYDNSLSSAKERLTEEEFSSAWEEGQKMTSDQAVEITLKG